MILDYTGFTSTSQVPAQWLKFAAETIPLDIWKRLKTMRLLTPNTFALRYLRRLYNNLTSGTSRCTQDPACSDCFAGTTDAIHITMHTSLGDLLNNYSDGLSAPSLSYASMSHHFGSKLVSHRGVKMSWRMNPAPNTRK